MYISRAVSCFALVVLMVACGGGGGGDGGGSDSTTPRESVTNVKEAIAAAESMGQIPVLNHDASIAGPDSNGNGVRDDIDAYIAARPDSAAQKAALNQLAVAVADALTVDMADTVSVAAVTDKMMNSTVCLYAVYGPAQASLMSQEIEKFTISTLARLEVYQEFNSGLNGSTAKIPSGGGCAP